MRVIYLILFLISSMANATKIYMSASGSDGAAGTSPATAWQTTSKLNTQFLTSGDTVFFNRGDVFYGRLNLTKTGAAGNPVVYTTYGTGADPIITGYISLSTWTNNGGGIYAAAAPEIKQYAHNLVMDGKFQNIARFPNNIFLAYTNVSTTSIIDATQTGTPSRVGDSVVVKSSRYTLDHAKVTAQSTSTLTLSGLTYTGAGGNGYFYFNAPKWLDTLGEWCVNGTLDSVYVFFGGPGPTGHSVAVSTVDTLAYATGSYIKLNNLHFQGGNIANLLSPFGTGNIYINGGSNDYAYNAIDFRSQHDTIVGCLIRNVLNNGFTTPTNNITKYSLFYNNILRAIGLWPGLGVGGSGNYFAINNPSQGCTTSYNDIDSVGYHGIYFSGDSSVANYNHVNHHNMTMADGGGIYTWDASTISYTNTRQIIGNLVENGVGNIEGIVFDPSIAAIGIYCDGKSNLVNITGNTIANNAGSGFFCHGTNMTFSNNNVYNNLFAQCYLSEFSGAPITGTVIMYNSLVSPDTSKPVIYFFTPGSDILTMATADSNYYVTTNGVSPFRTQSNGGAAVIRNFTSWKTFMGFDTHSTYQTGVYALTTNTAFTSKNIYYSGRYIDPTGTIYQQLIPLPLLGSAILKTLNIGVITYARGAKIIPH